MEPAPPPTRRFDFLGVAHALVGGTAIAVAAGTAIGVAEMLLSALAREWALVEAPARHVLSYAVFAGLVGFACAPLVPAAGALLARFGRWPRAGVLVPAILSLVGAAYVLVVMSVAGTRWLSWSARGALAAIVEIALFLVATQAIALRPPAWSGREGRGARGLGRGIELALVMALALVGTSWLVLRTGWLPRVAPRGAAGWILAAAIHPMGAGLALLIEGALSRRIGRAGAVLRPSLLAAVALAVAAVASSGGARGPAPAPGSPNVVVVVIDGARPDAFSTAGTVASPTPGFDAVAAAGTRFEAARAPSPWCLPAWLALLAGEPASSVGVSESALGEFLPARRQALHTASARTLAERFAARGYATAAFSNNPWFGPSTGLDAGFADFFQVGSLRNAVLRLGELIRLQSARPWSHDQGAARIGASAARWAERHRDRPFLLVVDLVEPMPPFTPTEPFRSRVLAGLHPATLRAVREAAEDPIAWSLGMVRLDWRGVDALRGLHQAEVAEADQALVALIEGLDRAGLLANTILVATSDHGQVFDAAATLAGNHLTLGEGVLRVPLAIRGPGIPAGVRVAQPVSTLDLLPTLLELAGAEADAALPGRSFAPLWKTPGAAQSDRPFFAEYRRPSFHLDARKLRKPDLDVAPLDTDRFSVLLRGHKLVREGTGRVTAFDLDADPGEGNAGWERTPEGQVAVAALAPLLDDWLARRRGPAVAAVPDEAARASAAVLRQIPLDLR